MKIIQQTEYKEEMKREEMNKNEEIDKSVLNIISSVKKNGDKSLYNFIKKFDAVSLENLIVTDYEIKDAFHQVEDTFIQSINLAKKNIEAFHFNQLEKSWLKHNRQGVLLGQQITPLDRVGIYIPGGKAAYPSTVLMNAIPAIIAGVPDIAIATPPQADGTINPYVLVAAHIVGINTIYKMGGAHAIAAFAYGTETIPSVNKIVGPGNDFVARAKKWVYGDVAIDMIAGPSEILIIADEYANPAFVAADLLSQAEHDEAASSICITTNRKIAERIASEIKKQLPLLNRKEIAKASIEQNGKIIITNSIKEAISIANDIAPEHLQLMIENASEYIHEIKHAGAIFVGDYSPEPLGDYVAGPNHTLPTSGTAKFASPLGVYDFQKRSSIIRYSKEALLAEADAIETIAEIEGLTGHAKSISLRRD